MKPLVIASVRLVRAAQGAYMRKWRFLGMFAIVFLGNLALLARLDLLPEPPRSAPNASSAESPLVAARSGLSARASVKNAELPIKILIPAIGLSADIANPSSTQIATLDAALLSGAVRYPTSARLGEDGNTVLFGHSSYLPLVYNRAYKTFDGVQNLTGGERITVYSADTAYTYAVKTVARENALDAAIPLSVAGRVLTLSTCDSFGKKSDRFVVTADFVESHALSS